jgi:hypothetical protein
MQKLKALFLTENRFAFAALAQAVISKFFRDKKLTDRNACYLAGKFDSLNQPIIDD